MRRRHHQSRVFYDLSSLIFNILRSPPTPFEFSDQSPVIPTTPPAVSSSRRPPVPSITPAGFASLLLGISLSLMLCGSVTFLIGFILMPWVLGLVMVLYFLGIVSSLTMLGRTILCYATSLPSRPKEVPAHLCKLFWKIITMDSYWLEVLHM